jgi:hypothetical protein
MGARRAGAVIQIAGDAMFVMMVFVSVLMGVFADVRMRMAVLAAIGMAMGVRMNPERRLSALVRVLLTMLMRVAMHRAILVDMGVFMRILARFTLDLRFSCSATANRTHRLTSCSPTRFRFP